MLIHQSGLTVMTLAENLQKLRKDKGLKQEQLAELSGVSITQISKIERNETDPRVSTLEKLAKALQCSADKLVFNTENTSLNGALKKSFERAMKLHPREKGALLSVINMACAGGVMIKTAGEYFEEAKADGMPIEIAAGQAVEDTDRQQWLEGMVENKHDQIDIMVTQELETDSR